VRNYAPAVLVLALLLPPAQVRAASPGQAAADHGAGLFRDGDYAGAREAFREAVRLDPRLFGAWEGLGWAEYRLGDADEALRIWRDVLRVEPGRESTRAAIAAAERLRGRRGAAAHTQPPGPAAPAPAGARTGQAAEPRAAPIGEPRCLGGPAALLLQAKEALDVEDAAAAERSLACLVSLRPEEGWAARMAELFVARRDFERGLEFFARQVPRDFPGRGPAVSRIFVGLARQEFQAGRFSAAAAALEGAVAADAERWGALRDLGVVYRRLGLFRKARLVTARLAGHLPEDVEAQRQHAEVLSKVGDFGEAALQWGRVVQLDPSIEVYARWLQARYQAGEADGAVREARALASAPGAPIPLFELLASDALARDDLDDAALWHRALTRREPERLDSWRTLLHVLGRQGRLEEQVAIARQALLRLPDRVELELDLVSALREAGRVDEALRRAGRIVELHPDDGLAYRMRLGLLADAGRDREALDTLSRGPRSFFTEDERRLLEASLHAGVGDASAARDLLRFLVRPPPGVVTVPILLYHGVVPVERSLQSSAAVFEGQMAALAASGYHPVTVSELARMLDGAVPFPPRPILITFDDARSDTLVYADPILARHGFRATMFVPTGLIPPEDGFYVEWRTLARYAATGRWDLQGHGHDAHGHVPVDAGGSVGEFLVYRAWLPDRGRIENGDELAARLDGDYRRCRSALEEHVPGVDVVGYAYPYNHLALAQPPSAGVVPFLNEALTRRHFRFGFVQDERGYNTLSAGSPQPLLLRRYAVPRGWTGRQLLAHLARNEPASLARVALARLALAEGRPAAARAMIDRLVREEPLLGPELEGERAAIAWGDDRPREAAVHLAARPAPTSPAGADSLPARVAFRNRSRVGLDSSLATDSDRRALFGLAGVVVVPLPPPVDLRLRVGTLRLSQPGASAEGPEVTGIGTAAVGRSLDLTGWGRLRRLRPSWSLDGGASARLRLEQQALEVQWSRQDVDTVAALARRIRSDAVVVGYALDAARWRGELGYTRQEFTDGNERDDVHARLLRLFEAGARWGLGASYDREDCRFAAPEYYAPLGLHVILGRGMLELARRSSALALHVGAGIARDQAHGTRAAGRVELRLTQGLGERALLTVRASASRVSSYASAGGGLLLELRL
jgi:tetratricopeptide (TPR) repeat protein